MIKKIGRRINKFEHALRERMLPRSRKCSYTSGKRIALRSHQGRCCARFRMAKSSPLRLKMLQTSKHGRKRREWLESLSQQQLWWPQPSINASRAGLVTHCQMLIFYRLHMFFGYVEGKSGRRQTKRPQHKAAAQFVERSSPVQIARAGLLQCATTPEASSSAGSGASGLRSSSHTMGTG